MTAIFDPLLIPAQPRVQRTNFAGSTRSGQTIDFVITRTSGRSTSARVSSRESERVFRRRRIMVAAVSVLAVLGFVFMTFGGSAVANEPGVGNANVPTEIVVQQGDTLWEIARRIAPSGNITNLVDELVRLNGADLHVGQIIRVP